MGKRGPKARKGKATATPSRPYAPRDLEGDARAAWDRLCDDLEAAGTVDATDRSLILIYARTHALWLKVDAELSAQLLAISDQSLAMFPETRDAGETGPPAPDPPEYPFRLANLHLGLTARLRQLLLDFGLSPSTRKPRDAAPDGPWLGLIGGQGGL